VPQKPFLSCSHSAAPVLAFGGGYPKVFCPVAARTLVCVASLHDVEFQLLVPRSSTSPHRVTFDQIVAALGNGGPFTCHYRLCT
jgi:hypothetical protein